MGATVTLSETAGGAAFDVADAGLTAFNAPFVGEYGYKPFSLQVRRDDSGPVVGGAFGYCYGGWYFLQYLFLPEDLRGGGLGRRLMAQVEAEAKARGCLGVWLTSYAFQAPDFYAKQGYVAFGRIEDSPPGHLHHFLMKRFT